MLKLIAHLIVITALVLFIGANAGNSVDVDFGFARLEQVPSILLMGLSFVAGAIFAIPYMLLRKKEKRSKTVSDEPLPSKSKTKKKRGKIVDQIPPEGAVIAKTEVEPEVPVPIDP